MIALFGILFGLLTSVAHIYFLMSNKSIKNIIHAVFKDTILVFIFSYGALKFILKPEHIYTLNEQSKNYLFAFLSIHFAVSAIYFLFLSVKEKIPFLVKAEPKRKKGAMVVKLLSTVNFILGVAMLTGTFWGLEFFGDLTPDQIIINLNSPTEGTDISVYIGCIEGPVLLTVFFGTLFCLFSFSDYKIAFTKNEKLKTIYPCLATRILSIILSILMFLTGMSYLVTDFELMRLYRSYVLESDFIEDNFGNPNEVKLTFPKKKRNLIHIYLESMENTFLSKELGGIMEDNLIPHLYKLSSEGISFSHKSEGLGGPQNSTGAGWSVSSMVNQGTGLPMKVPDRQNQYGDEDNFLPGATAIGDILKEQGYEQTVMFGANADFGGLTYYFKSHGDYTIIDHKEAKKRGLIPKDYKVFWGYEDDKLYEFAKDELTRLYETGKPFHFMMETADTHTPEGYLSKDAPKPYDSKYANAVRYSQEQTYNFIRWIQKQPFYENTTIVIIGDHHSMAKKFFESIEGIDEYHRSCYNLILNPAPGLEKISKERCFNRQWAMFDMFPTLLAGIGVKIEGDRLGIGTNLFSDKATVFEEFGIDFVNNELDKRSDFYNTNILSLNIFTDDDDKEKSTEKNEATTSKKEELTSKTK